MVIIAFSRRARFFFSIPRQWCHHVPASAILYESSGAITPEPVKHFWNDGSDANIPQPVQPVVPILSGQQASLHLHHCQLMHWSFECAALCRLHSSTTNPPVFSFEDLLDSSSYPSSALTISNIHQVSLGHRFTFVEPFCSHIQFRKIFLLPTLPKLVRQKLCSVIAVS